ncbi:MAG: DUF6485 family protein [Planctomycetota bacterium]|nr:DUF6485 family protein [Planctomycetota bacterium]
MPERDPCVNLDANKKICTCSNISCENHGICCRCVLRHRDGQKLPACLRHFVK